MPLGLATLAVSALLAGAPSPEWVQWNAPDACPAVDALQDATEARLGRTLTADEVQVEATIEDRGAEGLSLVLTTTREGLSDEHTMLAHDCRALVDAAALMIALSVDAVAVAERVELPDAEAPSPSVAPIVEPLPPVTEPAPRRPPPKSEVQRPTPAPPADRAMQPSGPLQDVLLRGGGSLLFASLPGISGGPNVSLAVGWPRLRLELGGWYAAPRRTDPQPAVVAVQVGAGNVRGCVRIGSQRIEVPLCGGMEVGGMRGVGEQTPDATTTTGVWVAPTASGGLHAWLTDRFGVVARVQLAVPIAYPGFEIRGTMETVSLFEPASISGRLFLGIEGKMWRRRDGSGR